MRATAEPVEGNRIRLSIEVDETEVNDALSATIRRLGRQVRIPGFRPGKVPRQVLEARLGGVAALRQQAINDILPDLYAQAVVETAVDPITAPEIDVRGGDEAGPLTVDAVVEVRPVVSVAGYLGLQITVPDVTVGEEEVDRQIDRLRDNDGELVAVDRPIETGDYVTIDLHAGREGATSDDDLDVEDFVYEVGSDTGLPGLDDELQGASAGAVLTFVVPGSEPEATEGDQGDSDQRDDDQGDSDQGDDEVAEGDDAGTDTDGSAAGDEDGTEAAAVPSTAAGADVPDTGSSGGAAGRSGKLVAQVTVKEVQQKILPEPTDEWAAEASEFSTLAELRRDLRDRLQRVKVSQLQMVLRERTTEAVVALVSEEPPASMVDAEVNERLHDLSHRLEERKMDVGEFLARSGRDEAGLVEELRAEARRAVLLDLALRALADAEAIEVSDEELRQVLVDMARQVGTSPEDLFSRLERAGRLPSVRSERRKAKALEWLEEHVELVDESGKVVARSDLEAIMAGGGAGDGSSAGTAEPVTADPGKLDPPSDGDATVDTATVDTATVDMQRDAAGIPDGSEKTRDAGPGSQPQEGNDVEVDS